MAKSALWPNQAFRNISSLLSPDWMKISVLNCGWFAVVKGAMKNYNNYGGVFIL